MTTKPQFLIAAPSSGSGKTTITHGLLRHFKNSGFLVQSFKCGPDYLDTKHHEWASGNVSINLDLFMSSKQHVSDTYAKYSSKADIAVIEGVMGLFDGAKKMEGSSAKIAELLDIPIVFVVNAKATAYSVAPLLYGFKNFYPKIKIVGVIFNFVNSESHYQFLKEACTDVGITPLGYVPKNDSIHLPSRHLGLQISAPDQYDSIIDNIALHLAKTVNFDKLLKVSKTNTPNYSSNTQANKKGDLKITIAKDEAFNFIYYENLSALEREGNITYFSPLKDKVLPETDVLYLAGGYPELYLQELSENTSMLESIYDFCNMGGKVFAECGGMMYLSTTIIDSKGTEYPMIGFLNQKATMQDMKLSLGYRKIKIDDHIFFGHEFHYSKLTNFDSDLSIGEVYSARDKRVTTHIFHKKNTFASYIHFYWGEKSILSLFKNDK